MPRPPWDPQDVADAATPEERVAASGVTGDSDADRRAAYAAYLAMLGSGTVQLAVKVAHEYLNKRSLVVSSGPDGERFRIYGDHTLLASHGGSAPHCAGGGTVPARDRRPATGRGDLRSTAGTSSTASPATSSRTAG